MIPLMRPGTQYFSSKPRASGDDPIAIARQMREKG